MRKKWNLQNVCRKMKLLFFLVVLGFCHCHAKTHAQNVRVDLDVNNSSLAEVFRLLEQKTDYTFIFKSEDVLDQKVSLNVKNEFLKDVLTTCLDKTNLTFVVQDDVIVIRKATQSQQVIETIQGIVKDVNGYALPGVTVMIKGTSVGVATNTEGRFEIVKPTTSNFVLRFSFMGMKTKEVSYKGEKELQVVLEDDTQEVDEVVVTGYQIIDRKKLTSSVYSIKMDDLMIQGATSLDQMLEGRIPDMIFMTNSGEVGVVPRLRIRGTSTLIGNREPIWVVDGIIVEDPVSIDPDILNDPDYVNRIGNAISGLNPQDIERIDVLKDAAATALYGTRAANGVIVITTKKGHIGTPVINYNVSSTYKRRPRYSDRNIDLMNSKERIQFSRDLYRMHYRYAADEVAVGYEGLLQKLYSREITDEEFEQEVVKLETNNTDWFKLLTTDIISHQHTLSVSGGTDNTRYYNSVGYTRDNDVIKDAYSERYTIAMRLNTNFYKWLNAAFGVNAYVNDRKYNITNAIDYAYNTSRVLPAYDENGDYFYYKKGSSSYKYNFNILNELKNSHDKQKTNSMNFNTNLSIRFAEWINANVIFQYGISNYVQEKYNNEKTWYASNLRYSEYGEEPGAWYVGSSVLPYGGELQKSEVRNRNYTVRTQLNIAKSVGEYKQHNLRANFGHEVRSVRAEGMSQTIRGYDPDRGLNIISNSEDKYTSYVNWLRSNRPTLSDNLNNNIGVYGSIMYGYLNNFNLNFNMRWDGSNKFGEQSNKKILPIWSVSGNYNLTEHFNRQNWINYLSLKVSFGHQGNMQDGQSPVMIIKQNALNTYYNKYTASINTYANPNLRWEKTATWNTGLSVALFDNRFKMEAEYYHKKTNDAFLNKIISTINGMSQYLVNSGVVKNQGFSIDLSVEPIRTQKTFWKFTTSISKIYNKLNTLPGLEEYQLSNFLNGTALINGKQISTFYSYKFVGLNPLDGGPIFDDNEERIDELKGLSKYETYTKVLKPSGSREPTISGSLFNTFLYGNFRMGLTLAYSLGAKTRLFRLYDGRTSNGSLFTSEGNVNRVYLNRWRKPGDEKTTNIPAIIVTNSTGFYNYNAHFSTGYVYGGEVIANNSWDMYDYGDVRVVSSNYLKCSNISFTYDFPQRILDKLKINRLEATLSSSNLFTISAKELKGQTPIQGGFTEINLSERPTFTFTLNLGF